jgi:hypothetical protein
MTRRLRAQKGEVDETPDVAPGDAIAFGQLLERSGASGGEFLKPCPPARDRLDQRGFTSRSLVLYRHPGSGDGVLIEFGSVVGAVQCAIAIVSALFDRTRTGKAGGCR